MNGAKTRRLRLGLVLILFSAACGGSDQTPSGELTNPTSPPTNDATAATQAGASGGVEDACALLGTDDLAASTGGSWGDPRLVPGVETIECDFVEEETRSKLFVAVYRPEAVEAAGGPEDVMASLAYPAGTEGTPIEAGDRAAFFEFPHVYNFVVMEVNGSVVHISGETSFGMTFDQASMTALAGIVADKL